MKNLYISTLILTTLLAACASESAPTSKPDLIPANTNITEVVAEGKLLPIPSVELAFAQPGSVAEVLVNPGQDVAAGEVIARLQNIEALQAEVAQAEEAFLLAEQAFDRAEAGAMSALAFANEAVRQAHYDFDNFDTPSELRDMTTDEALIYTYEKLEQARSDFKPYKYLEERLEWEIRREDPTKHPVYRNTAKIYKKRQDDAWAEYKKGDPLG